VSHAARVAVDLLLGSSAAACWLGALGMMRMRDPFQALHYLALPAIAGLGTAAAAIWIETGWTQATWKSLMILAIFIIANSVGTHAAARAFRARRRGHWEPLPDDADIEFLGERHTP